jgi:hypothetical protein
MATVAIQNQLEQLLGNQTTNFESEGFLNSSFSSELLESAQYYQNFEDNKRLIEFHREIDRQFEELEGVFSEIDSSIIKEKTTEIYDGSLNFKLDIEKIELTNDCSLFITLREGAFTVYIDKYLDDSEDELNAIIFNGDEKLPSLTGEMDFVMQKIKRTIDNKR